MKAILRDCGSASLSAATALNPAVRKAVTQPDSISARTRPVWLSCSSMAPSIPASPRAGLSGLTITDLTTVLAGASLAERVVIR